MKNLLDITEHLSSENEVINAIIDNKSVRVDQIISTGQSSPKDFWYDQDESEWVLLLQGAATIKYKDNSTITLVTGDSLLLPAHVLHRVDSTKNPTIWLAIFFSE